LNSRPILPALAVIQSPSVQFLIGKFRLSITSQKKALFSSPQLEEAARLLSTTATASGGLVKMNVRRSRAACPFFPANTAADLASRCPR
jgi:hypothetical protein